ncbi:hypothetical protein ACPA54_25605 [Uniformispora flossi]|uniref:hypothetical protein n=1 Tax=Uniformispora flossi TaxID=3390723 RepID=UPI003C303DCB
MTGENPTHPSPAAAAGTGTPTGGHARGDALAVLEKFYAAEADYIAAGGPGKASFDELAACLDPDVVMYHARVALRGHVARAARHRGVHGRDE